MVKGTSAPPLAAAIAADEPERVPPRCCARPATRGPVRPVAPRVCCGAPHWQRVGSGSATTRSRSPAPTWPPRWRRPRRDHRSGPRQARRQDHGRRAGRRSSTYWTARSRRAPRLAVAWGHAAATAESAAQATADLKPKVGRARPLAERSLGTPDAGAVSFALCVRTAAACSRPTDRRTTSKTRRT